MTESCPFCGEAHGSDPVSYAGIEIKVCPAIPLGHAYENREYPSGPPGALHRLFVLEEGRGA
jgi:hypothetical protein